jgi:hypothetical protein
MDQSELYRRIRTNEEYRQLASDPAFQVSIDIGGRFFRAMIGDKGSAFIAWRRVRTLETAIEWLQSEVRKFYPHSRSGEHLAAREWRAVVPPF